MPELERILATKIAATPSALDAAVWPEGSLVLRIAPDEVLVTPPVAAVAVDDPHAIVVPDAGYAGVWMAADQALALLERACEWEIPKERPAFAQGAIAGIPTKVWLEQDRVLFMVPAPYWVDFEDRML